MKPYLAWLKFYKLEELKRQYPSKAKVYNYQQELLLQFIPIEQIFAAAIIDEKRSRANLATSIIVDEMPEFKGQRDEICKELQKELTITVGEGEK